MLLLLLAIHLLDLLHLGCFVDVLIRNYLGLLLDLLHSLRQSLAFARLGLLYLLGGPGVVRFDCLLLKGHLLLTGLETFAVPMPGFILYEPAGERTWVFVSRVPIVRAFDHLVPSLFPQHLASQDPRRSDLVTIH